MTDDYSPFSCGSHDSKLSHFDPRRDFGVRQPSGQPEADEQNRGKDPR